MNATINICTLADSNYLAQGIALAQSINTRATIPVTIHFLCIDQEAYDILDAHPVANLKLYRLSDIDMPPELYLWYTRNKEYKYFCWALASYFTAFVQIHTNAPVVYIDSDIYFHEDIGLLMSKIEKHDIAIFRHRQFELTEDRPEGLYNVGVVYFNNTPAALDLLFWWRAAVMAGTDSRYNSCGDQKYLEEFVKRNADVYVDGDVGHGAPWHWQLYELDKLPHGGYSVKWQGQTQLLIFTHFSQFKLISGEDGGNFYIPSLQHHCYTPLCEYVDNATLKGLYDGYFQEVNAINQKIKAA